MTSWEDFQRKLAEENLKPWYAQYRNRPRVLVQRAVTKLHQRRQDVLHAYQRVVRGWDDPSWWSLDSSLTKQLGAQLVKLSDETHGHPEDVRAGLWVSQLSEYGHDLIDYDPFNNQDSVAPAKNALRWVADNLEDLWD